MSILFFLIALALLILCGCALAVMLLGKKNLALALSLSLPLGSLINVLITAMYTFVGVPLNIFTLWGGLAATCGVIFFAGKKMRSFPITEVHEPQLRMNVRWQIILRTFCCLLLGANLFYAFSHAVLLPSFQIDSLTNWTMRSQVSFTDEAIAFDRTEERGVAKPQYPFLFHALQITANQGQQTWNDSFANTITFLLSHSSFAAAFLLLKKLTGTDAALLTLTLVLSIPLVGLHLAQGYADIHLLGFGLLALLSLAMALRTQSSSWFFINALFIATCVWTKSEGLYAIFIPWALLLVWQWQKNASRRKVFMQALALGAGLSAIYYILLLVKGLPLTPHASDAGLVWRPDAWMIAVQSLFTNGSFGLIWYVIVVLLIGLVRMVVRNDPRVDRLMLPLLFWGLLAFAATMFIYTFTPNVAFLLNAQSFYRQMLVPAAMLMTGCLLIALRSD